MGNTYQFKISEATDLFNDCVKMTVDFNSKLLTTPCKRTLRNYDVRRLNVETSSAEWTTDARARACADVSNFLSFGHELAFRWKNRP